MNITKNNSMNSIYVCCFVHVHAHTCPCGNWGKGKIAAKAWKKADIRGLRRLQHLEAILLLCCGQVRCIELNSNTTMAKRAAETKGLSLLLNPFATGGKVTWGTN